MTASDTQVETWKRIPGAKWFYEASDQGRIRSLPHKTNGRDYPGKVLAPREDSDGYLVVNITMEDGTRKNGTSVARLVLLTFDPDGYAPGLEACHGPNGKKDNRVSELRWDTDEANREEALALRLANNPPKRKPLKTCPRCRREHDGPGRNCHECFVGLGVAGAQLLAGGTDLQEASDRLGYPPVALVKAAKLHGGLRLLLEEELNAMLRAASHPPSRLRRVLSRREASRQNSDAQ